MQKQYAYFSAAIRDGAKLRPQAFGDAFRDGKSCALGAGYEAMVGDIASVMGAAQSLLDTFPYLERQREMTCPADCFEPLTEIAGAITHLNDDHKWSREAIADWLYNEEEELGFVTLLTEEEPDSSIQRINREPELSGVFI